MLECSSPANGVGQHANHPFILDEPAEVNG